MRPRCGLALPRRHAGRLAWLVAAAASRQDSYMSLLAARVEELRRDREHGASWMARRTVETLLEVAEEANALVDRRRRAAASIAIQLRGSLEDAVVATHSASATVREALLRTPPRRVLCTVSNPIGEGRGFAEELRREGLVVELLEDVDAPAALKDAALFLVGADTVFRDGTLCNKIGTTALAEAAAARGLPTIVASETVKLAPIEAADAPEPSPAERSLFELTPPELISEIVTEEGSVTSDGVGSLVDRTPFLREGYALLLPAVAL